MLTQQRPGHANVAGQRVTGVRGASCAGKGQLLRRGRGMFLPRALTSRTYISTHTVKRLSTSYVIWIFLPAGKDLKRAVGQYDQLGFKGAIGSIDETLVYFGWATASHA